MAFAISLKESLSDGLARVAREQAQRARRSLTDPTLTPMAQVHETRKALKRLRAVLRLWRPELDGTGRDVEVLARDLGRRLSDLRDRDVAAAALLRLAGDEVAFTEIRTVLTASTVARDEVVSTDQSLTTVRSEVERGLAQLTVALAGLQVTMTPKLAAAAIKQVHRRTVRAARAAAAEDSPETLHEWRKQVKYYGYVAQIFGKAWPSLRGPRIKHLNALGEVLGLDRDSLLLEQALAQPPVPWREPRSARALAALAREERRQLLKRAFKLADKIECAVPKKPKRALTAVWPASARGHGSVDASIEAEDVAPTTTAAPTPRRGAWSRELRAVSRPAASHGEAKSK